jgi:hypothetical protein
MKALITTSPNTTHISATVPVRMWAFMYRECDDAANLRKWLGGTYAIDGIAPAPFLGAIRATGAVVDDFGDLVPVERPR